MSGALMPSTMPFTMLSAMTKEITVQSYSFILPLIVSRRILALELIKGVWYAHVYVRFLFNFRVYQKAISSYNQFKTLLKLWSIQ